MKYLIEPLAEFSAYRHKVGGGFVDGSTSIGSSGELSFHFLKDFSALQGSRDIGEGETLSLASASSFHFFVSFDQFMPPSAVRILCFIVLVSTSWSISAASRRLLGVAGFDAKTAIECPPDLLWIEECSAPDLVDGDKALGLPIAKGPETGARGLIGEEINEASLGANKFGM
jgi:hypothetical protein